METSVNMEFDDILRSLHHQDALKTMRGHTRHYSEPFTFIYLYNVLYGPS